MGYMKFWSKKNDRFPLTEYQKSMWYEQLNNPQNPVFNAGGCLEIEGYVDKKTFELAIKKIVAKNDALRIVISESGGKAEQQILRKVDYIPEYYDFSTKSREDALAFIQKKFCTPFTVVNNVLFDFTLIKLSEKSFVIVSIFHHIIIDGWGCALVYRQLLDYYEMYLKHSTKSVLKTFLHSKTFFYSNYIEETLLYERSQRIEIDREYWYSKFESYQHVSIDEKYNCLRDGNLRKELFLDNSLIEKLSLYVKEHNCSVAHCVFAALYLSINYAFKKDDIVIGFPVPNREKLSERLTVGFFDNIIPVRIAMKEVGYDLHSVMSFISKDLYLAYRHCKYPFHDVSESININYESLFEVMFTYVKIDFSMPFLDYKTNLLTFSNNHEATVLTVIVEDFNKGGIKIYFDYKEKAFSDAIGIDEFVNYFFGLLKAVVNNKESLSLK